MKKLLVAIAALAATCFSSSAFAALNVVTSTQDLAAIATEIGGADVSVNFISRGDLDPHFVDAKPSYMVKLSQADLVIVVGLELEIGWMPNLISGSRNPKITPGAPGYLDASTGVTPIEVPSGTIDRSRGDLHPLGNPHYWLNPENGRGVARVVEARLAQLDPAHQSAYQANLVAFEAKLNKKIAEWAVKMAPLRGSAIVGYHSTYDYLASYYGLNVVGFVEPKPGIPPTPAHTLEISNKAKETGAKFILVEPYHDPEAARPVSQASGAKVVVLPTSVGAEAGVKTYTDLFDRIVALLAG